MTKFIILILFIPLFAQEYIISDYDFTNQNFTYQQTTNFIKSYPNNRLTASEMEIVYRYCVMYEINIILALAVMQKESDLLLNNAKDKYEWRKSRAFGYGMFRNFRRDGLKFYEYGGYYIQAYFAIKTLRKLFDEWKPGIKKEVIDLKKWVVPQNASSYSLLRYNPFYGVHNEYNWEYDAIGNKAFETLIPEMKKRWSKVNGTN